MTKHEESYRRWQFANIEELVEYVASLTGIEPLSNESIRMSSAQVRRLGQVRAGEDDPARFRNPVLNQITSPHGELMVGSQSFNVEARRLGSSRPGLGTFDSPTDNLAALALTCFQDASGLQICQSDDGRLRTYTDGSASMSFRSYREKSWWGYWDMGTEIKTSGSNFEAAIINSRYYGEALAQTCSIIYDQDSDANDNYLEESESGFGPLAAQPTRVESLCRVQWNGRRISGVVSAGNTCFVVGGVQPWPDGYPADWPPLSQPDPVETIGVQPASLEFISRPSSPSTTKTVTVKSSFLSPVTVTVEDATVDTSPSTPDPFEPPPLGGALSGEFSNVSGQFTIPPNGSMNVPVTFTGESGFGTIPGSLRITWNSGQRTVSLLGRLVEEAFL
jgi:hypothetical protein